MRVWNVNHYQSFKGAKVNITALSDTHGHIEMVDSAYQSIIKNNALKEEKRGVENYLIVGGDWFMSGEKKGYKSAPDKPLMDFQLDMYNKFVGELKKKFPRLKSLFIPGNHEFDGGSDLFQKAAEKLDSTIISSNMDTDSSTLLKKDIESGHIVSSTIDFVQDDKDENKSYPVLNVGISPVNMKYYKKYLTGIEFINNIPLPQKLINPPKYILTTEKVRDIAEDFKKKNPDGIAVLTCHTGSNFAQNAALQGLFDIIFNAHEHKNDIETVNNTPIVNLSQNFNKIVNAEISIDDNGKKEDIKFRDFNPKSETYTEESDIGKFYTELFKEDSKKIYTIKCSDSSIKELGTEGIRQGNNHLANFVTDILLSEAKKRDPLVNIFAINASAIRGGFNVGDNPNTTNVQVLNCLSGINTSQADIYTTDIKGEDLIVMIMDNFLYNLLDKEKNPIIHYSGISIDKTGMMDAYHRGKDFDELCEYVTLSDSGKEIRPYAIYRIANPIKYFEKAQTDDIRQLIKHSNSLNCNIHELFSDYFNKHSVIQYKPDNRIY